MLGFFLPAVLVVLLANMAVCLVPVLRGPAGRDRLVGVILAGTTGAAVMATASFVVSESALRDVALVIVALAAVVAVSRMTAEADRDS